MEPATLSDSEKVIRIPFLLILLFLPIFNTSSLPWSGHAAFTYLVIVNSGLDFSFKVVPREKHFSETRLYRTDGQMSNFLKIDVAGLPNPKLIEPYMTSEFGFLNAPPAEDGMPAWQVVSLYSAFPDIGIDYLPGFSLLQDLLLGDSQAVRHAKVKVGPFEVFEGDASFLYFMSKARELLRTGDTYWGLRFLGYALHYLQDLMQPYHVTPGRVWELIQYPFNPAIRSLLRNAHTATDRLLAYLILYERGRIEKLIAESKPIRIAPDEQLILEAVLYSYSKFTVVHELTKMVFKDLSRRAPGLEEIRSMSADPNFQRLTSEVLDIASKMAGLMKGLLEEVRKIIN